MYDPDIVEALTFIKQLVANGVVDPELIANTGRQHLDKIYQGNYGLIYHPWTDIAKNENQEEIKTVNPKAEWVQIKALTGPGGNLDGSYDVASVSRMWAFPKALENDPDKLEKIIDLFNYISEEEGNLLVMYGFEGINYEKDGAEINITNEEGVGHSHIYQFTGRPNADYLAAKFGYIQEEIDFAIAQPRVETYNSVVRLPEGYVASDAERYIEEEIIKFVYGNRPLEEYDEFLQTLESTFNYDVYVASAKEQINEYLKQ